MFLTADFGTTSATVGYTLKDATGGDAQARTTSGVTDLGNGMYGVEIDLPPTAVAVKWDTGGGTPVYAHEDLIAEQNNIFLRNRNESDPITAKQYAYHDDGTTVYMEADIYSDHTASTPYAGDGIARRNRYS